MRRGPVILVGRGDDPHVAAVARALRGSHVVLDPRHVEHGGGIRVEPDTGRWWWNGSRLPAPRSVYVKEVPTAWPPTTWTDDGEAVVLQRWMTPYMLSREREAVVRALLSQWTEQGVPMLNPAPGGSVAQHKLVQLRRAHECGVPVPRTLVTNEPATAAAFCRRHRHVIAKPVNGGALTLDVSGWTEKKFRPAMAAPLILQQRAPGADVRLYMLGSTVLSCASVETDDGPHLDFRGSEQYQAGRARYRYVELPSRLLDSVADWMTACGLVFAGVDVKVPPRGRPVVLECNPAPIFMDQQLKTADDISGALAAWLAAPPVQQ